MVIAKKEKVATESKFLRDNAEIGLCVKRSLLLSLVKRNPKNGVKVRQAQKAKRSYVNHSHALPKTRCGNEVVPPRPSRKSILNEPKRPKKRGCHLRKRNGMTNRSGPYIGKKNMAIASESFVKSCRDK